MAEKKYHAEKRILYDNRERASKEKLWAELKAMDEFPGEYLITIRLNRPVRSIKQNAYYHFVLSCIITMSEAGAAYTHDRLHRIASSKFNYKLEELPKGDAVLVGQSTSDIDVDEFVKFTQKVKAWAYDEFEVIIPAREDVDYKKWMDVENSYHKKFYGF